MGQAGLTRLRLTRRVFWDLAVYMVGLGLAVGVVFPPFAILLGVPGRVAARPVFVLACLGAGFIVGAVNYALCRGVVGGRLAVLSSRLRSAADTVAHASRTGDWAGSPSSRIAVDSDDQLGATAQAFNSLLDALEDGEHFRSLVRNASDVITVVDPDGTITYQTPSIASVLGYPPAVLVGTAVQDLLHPDDAAAFADHLAGVVTGPPQAMTVESRMRHRDGTWRWVETVASNLLDDQAVNGVVLTTRAIGDRKDLEERLRTQAFHDPLTGLPNRALFMDRLRDAESLEQTTGTPLAVLFCDLDNLKTVNDKLGHEGGDLLLRAVTEQLCAGVRGEGTVARLSGDEFAILLTGTDSAARAQCAADRILTSLRDPVRLGDRDVHTGLSIGVASSSTSAASGIGLLRAADVAMYVAKTTGKGRCEVFQPSHHADHLDRERLRADLHQALDEQQFAVHYQPIVDLGTGEVRAFEALLRWHHPQRGVVSPATFIPLAEESGLIVPIGRWVTGEATRQAALWQAAGCGPLRMSVNVSARQFQHPALVRDVAEALRASGLDPHLLTLEITETLLVHDTVGTAAKLAELKDLGVRIALDDFGTGYSSLSYLRRFPIDVLKVDKSFVDGVATCAEDSAVAAAVIQLGTTLRLQVVAEGLETREQVDAVTALACPLGQGYYFARPMPAAEAALYLATAPRPRDDVHPGAAVFVI